MDDPRRSDQGAYPPEEPRGSRGRSLHDELDAARRIRPPRSRPAPEPAEEETIVAPGSAGEPLDDPTIAAPPPDPAGAYELPGDGPREAPAGRLRGLGRAGGAARGASASLGDELRTARSELGRRGRHIGIGAPELLVGGAFAAFTAFLILVLDIPLPAWLAALIVTLLYAVVAVRLLGG